MTAEQDKSHEINSTKLTVERIKIDDTEGIFVPEQVIKTVFSHVNQLHIDVGATRKHGNYELGATILTGVAIAINPLLSPVALSIVYENNVRKKHANSAISRFDGLHSGHFNIDEKEISSKFETEPKMDLTSPVVFSTQDCIGVFIPKETIYETREVFSNLLDELNCSHDRNKKRLTATVAMVTSSMFMSWLGLGLLPVVIYQNQKSVNHLKTAGKYFNKMKNLLFPEEVVNYLEKLGVKKEI